VIYDLIIAPFADYEFMRRALAACVALSVSAGPVGVMLLLRRMSLTGDAMSHGILPGAAIAFLISGYSVWALGLGGLIAGLTVVLAAGFIARTTILREDASLAAFYLSSLALGVLLISLAGPGVDLLHLLFGNILGVDEPGLILVSSVATVSLLIMALLYRPLLVESFDPIFLRTVSGRGSLAHAVFLTVVVLNLTAGFQTLGTVMAVGLMMLPAAAARLWMREVPGMMALASGVALSSSGIGLSLSFHLDTPSGATIVLCASVFYLLSVLVGREGGWLWRFLPGAHVHSLEQEHRH
jgi:zinc/manganese transport system permease protein